MILIGACVVAPVVSFNVVIPGVDARGLVPTQFDETEMAKNAAKRAEAELREKRAREELRR